MKSVLTEKGLILLGKAQAGANLSFTRMAIGDGIDLGDLSIRTALVNEVKSLPLINISREADKTYLKCSLNNTGLLVGYHIKEVGVFATDPDEGEILYSVSNVGNGEPDYMPPEAENIVELELAFVVSTINASSVTAVMDPSIVYARKSDAVDVRDMDPVTPGVLNQELSITVNPEIKRHTLKINASVTGGPITIKKNGGAAKPLLNPDGSQVDELLAEVMFYDVIEEAAAFILAPKSGGVQFADKNTVELKSFSTLETNYDLQLTTDELNYREGVTVPRSPYFLTQDYNSKQLVKDYDTGKIYMIARNSANNTVKCVEVNTLTGQLTLLWNKAFNNYPDPDAGVTIYKSELFMMGGSGNAHCIYKINLATGAIIHTAPRLHSTLTSWRIWGDQREKGKPIIYDGSTQAGAGIWKLTSNTVGGGFGFGYLNSSNGFSGPVSTDPNGNYWTHGYTYGYKISPAGTLIRQWTQAGYSASGRGYANVFNPNTNKYYAFAPLNNTNINQTRLGVFDDQGNEISSTDYTNRDCGYQGKAMYDGEYIVYNFSWNWGSVMKVDSNGNYVWDTKSTEGGPVIPEVKTTLWAIVLSETKQVVYCCNAYSDSNDIFRMQILEQATLDGYKPKADGGKRLILNAAVATTFLLAEDGNKNNFKSFKSGDIVKWSPTMLIKPESLVKLEKYLMVK